MAESTTQPTSSADVAAFIASVPDERRRRDAARLSALMQDVSGAPATMWGPSIVGFGRRHLVYDSGHELDYFEVGFSPRKAATTLYLQDALASSTDLLDRLGPHRLGKGCLYVTRLDDVDTDALRELVARTVAMARS